jgi:hypothetical protein
MPTTPKAAPRLNRKRRPATLGCGDIEKVDYAGQDARAVQVRTFSEAVPLLSLAEMKRVYESNALVFKGVNKRAKDAIRKGFVVVPDKENREDALRMNAAVRKWMQQTHYVPRAIKAIREMFALADGFLELVYADGAASDQAPPSNMAPSAVYNVDPLNILPVKDPKTGDAKAFLTVINDSSEPLLGVKKARDLDRRAVRAWAAGKGKLPKGVRAIHPDRMQHFQVHSLGDDPDLLGLSVIQIAYVNCLAKLAGDLAAGDILEWYSKGFFVLNIEFATPEELKAGKAQLEDAKRARKNHFVGSERSKFDIKSPSLPNVEPLYKNFQLEFAAALEMPTMVLTGNPKGTVTGSDADLNQYNDDNEAFQSLLLDDLMLDLVRRILNRKDVSIQWTPVYVEKQTLADIRLKDAQSAAQLYGGGILSRREVIRYLRTGELPDPEKVPEAYGSKIPDPPAKDPSQPRQKPVDDEPEEDALNVVPMDDVDHERVAELRKLGEDILREQGDLKE